MRVAAHSSRAAAAAFLAVAGLTFATAPANAEDPPWFVHEGPRTRALALELNPLAFLIGRYSLNLEYLIAPHHAFELSPHVYYALPGRDDEIDGFGTELGYRYYTKQTGLEGWFVGGSLAFGQYRYKHVAAPYVTANNRLLDLYQDTSYASLGGAIDAGYQVLLFERLAIGAGAGVQYTWFSDQPRYETISHAHHDLLYGSGIRPRVLLETGGAF